ncbi:MAG: ScpA family protein [Steroidobacteraceae bacterium]
MAKPKLKLIVGRPAQVAPAAVQPAQVEMPFAVVQGEQITELPRDLYIPPQALEVFLEAFEGPLDLLLYLIRRQNLDILDIPIAEITSQYVKYIDLMQNLELELAGEYLLMAATLAEIKSRMLLPRSSDADSNESDDPRAELVRRLQEYERFKQAAENIDRLPRLERDVWTAEAVSPDLPRSKPLPVVTLREMILAFRDVVARAEHFSHHHIAREPLSVRERMSAILEALGGSSYLEFQQLFDVQEGRMGIAVTFVAVLELMREGLIDVVQTEFCGPLHVRGAAARNNLRLVEDSDNAEPGQ